MGDLQFLNIDPTEDVRSGDFAPIPAGEYNLLVEEAESKRTKNGEGQYIRLRLQVLDGKHKGRVLYHNITVQNTSDKAVEIGRKALIILSRCKGKPLTDSAQLIGIAVRAKVKIRPAQNGYEEQNEVSAYLGPVGGDSTPKASPEVKRTTIHRSPEPAVSADDDDNEPPF